MAVGEKHSDVYAVYYCTFTCYKWLPLFEITNTYSLIYKWFEVLKAKNAMTLAYVLMPNHVHCILYFFGSLAEDPTHTLMYDLNKIIGNAKRFLAYGIIKELKEQNKTKILEVLKAGVSARDAKKGQVHKAFEESFDAKPIYNKSFLMQKVNYIHQNPVRGKWNLCEDYSTFEHSSASYYEQNEVKHFEPFDYNEIFK